MRNRVVTLRRDLAQSLWFVPGCIVALFFAFGVGLVEVDARLGLDGSGLVFAGDGPAARTVLSVVAGSLMTVAGLTFSMTIVVLQLASSQFSPRVLRTFFGDRVTQATIGSFVGIFVYALLVLRAVGSADQQGFVPRLGVTVATALAILAVVLLMVFLHHVTRMIQVSHVAAELFTVTREAVDDCHRRTPSEAATDEDDGALAGGWRAEEQPITACAPRAGFVRSLDEERLATKLAELGVGRAAVVVAPGDFVGPHDVLVELWASGDDGSAAADAVREAVRIGDERDLEEDVGFGLRQLTDIALKATSPAINDPATGVTCVGYLRSVLVVLAGRVPAPAVRRRGDLTLVLRRRAFPELLDVLRPLLGPVAEDPWLADELLATARACAHAAREAGAPAAEDAARAFGEDVGEVALAGASLASDIERLRRTLASLRAER